VEAGSPLGNARKKGRAKAEPKDNASVERCVAASREKNNLEEQADAVCDNDAAGMDWEEGHVEHNEYSHELGETVTVEFADDVPSSTNKKTVRRATAEEKVIPSRLLKIASQGIQNG
jgi:xeroderma pigmentosum group C-complementing protein